MMQLHVKNVCHSSIRKKRERSRYAKLCGLLSARKGKGCIRNEKAERPPIGRRCAQGGLQRPRYGKLVGSAWEGAKRPDSGANVSLSTHSLCLSATAEEGPDETNSSSHTTHSALTYRTKAWLQQALPDDDVTMLCDKRQKKSV